MRPGSVDRGGVDGRRTTTSSSRRPQTRARCVHRCRQPSPPTLSEAHTAASRRPDLLGSDARQLRIEQPLVTRAAAANRACIRLRAADSAANYYFASALMIAAGLEGIRRAWIPGTARAGVLLTPMRRYYPHAVGGGRGLPGGSLLHETFSPAFVSEYTEMKLKEWESDHLLVSDAERARYLLEL